MKIFLKDEHCLLSPINSDCVSCGRSKRKEENFHFVIKTLKFYIFLLNQYKSTV